MAPNWKLTCQLVRDLSGVVVAGDERRKHRRRHANHTRLVAVGTVVDLHDDESHRGRGGAHAQAVAARHLLVRRRAQRERHCQHFAGIIVKEATKHA